MSWFEKYADEAYALLRMVAGLLFGFHGLQILFGLYGGFRPPLGSQLWIGGLLELVGGAAILLGFQTRIAAFILSGMMAVAYVQFHWKFQFGAQFWPAMNQGEPAVIYCFIFLYMATRGGVKWCLEKTR